ncbi:DUF2461 domain-containing protein [Aeromicrobium sp. Leaf350]|uniref:DUF2461 domain-containing protein n=1 Tax=Aeromicrobium sp. Leaf350 TaxID=2876565 RepID=UPI001E41C03C|nr:DUF2461 domain-containing protein [Aeromicrobium sp. Leaf350]
MTFDGFPEAALDFYDDLEGDNTKTFWTENRHRYDEFVAAPAKAFIAAIGDEFGQAKAFRPYRDVRFSKDKTPYKTHQGIFTAIGPALGYYLQVSAPGIVTGAGFYDASPARVASLRDAIVHDTFGAELESIVEALESAGWERGGQRLKTSPRGYDAEHPRIDLLRHKTLTVRRERGFGPDVVGTAALLDVVRADWRETQPLLDWVALHVRG